jgi:hypothetical protein
MIVLVFCLLPVVKTCVWGDSFQTGIVRAYDGNFISFAVADPGEIAKTARVFLSCTEHDRGKRGSVKLTAREWDIFMQLIADATRSGASLQAGQLHIVGTITTPRGKPLASVGTSNVQGVFFVYITLAEDSVSVGFGPDQLNALVQAMNVTAAKFRERAAVAPSGQ